MVPFCSKELNSIGDPRCCIGSQTQGALDDVSFRSSNSIETMVDTIKNRN